MSMHLGVSILKENQNIHEINIQIASPHEFVKVNFDASFVEELGASLYDPIRENL